MWLSLSGSPDSSTHLEAIEQQMGAWQIAKAQELAAEWRAKRRIKEPKFPGTD
jgi:hypothetical protein